MRLFSVLVAAVAVVLVGAACSPQPITTPGTSPPSSTATLTVGGQQVTVSVPVGLTVTVASADPAALPATPAGLVLPFGAIAIDVQNVSPGEVARISVALPSPVTTVRKLISGVWDPFAPDGTTGASLSPDGLTVTLDLQDGGRGDSDGVADGTIVDPLVPGIEQVTITSDGVPTMTAGEPFTHQLQADWPGPATPTWSVLSGALPTGITLDASGVLSGTPEGSAGPSFVRVQATDGSTSDTKLLTLVALASSGPSATGLALPDGTGITMSQTAYPGPGATWLGTYLTDGTLSRLGTLSVDRLAAEVPGPVNRAGTRVVTSTLPPTPGPSTGPVVVVDGDTGAPIATLEPSPSFQIGSVSFSPNGAYLALGDPAGTTRVFDTTTWTVVRTLLTNSPGQPVWSPNSTELIPPGVTGGAFLVRSVLNPDADRYLNIAGQSCSQITDWSHTNRVALNCSAGVVTASAIDGTDARVVAPSTPCTVAPCTSYLPPRFSPSGTHLAMGVATIASTSPFVVSSQVVVGLDESNAALTPITDQTPTGLVVGPVSWTPPTTAPPPPPPPPPAPLHATAVDAGFHHACAIVVGGNVKCWGLNSFGQLGNGTAAGSSIPVDVIGVAGASVVAAGYFHTCALMIGGNVKCWGMGLDAQGNTTPTTATDVVGITDAVAISAGGQRTCVVVADGGIKCWTSNTGLIPIAVVGVTGATAVSVGAFHACALVAAGAVKCWGDNWYGQLGNGVLGAAGNPPVDVVGLTGATAVVVGNEHSCAVLAGGTVKCWGQNGRGQLGRGISGSTSSVPGSVVTVTGVSAIGAGDSHTCVVVAGGTVRCWGLNWEGQLGNRIKDVGSPTPVDVIGLSGVSTVSGDVGYECALVTGGTVKCWGSNNYGAVANPGEFSSVIPVTVLGGG